VIDKKETNALNEFCACMKDLRFARQSEMIVLIKIIHIDKDFQNVSSVRRARK